MCPPKNINNNISWKFCSITYMIKSHLRLKGMLVSFLWLFHFLHDLFNTSEIDEHNRKRTRLPTAVEAAGIEGYFILSIKGPKVTINKGPGSILSLKSSVSEENACFFSNWHFLITPVQLLEFYNKTNEVITFPIQLK